MWRSLLALEAESWIGTTEATGHNDGALVRLFQMAVNKYPSREAWCMDFIDFCAERVDKQLDLIYRGEWTLAISRSESVISTWNDYTRKPFFRRIKQVPAVGNLAVWRRGSEMAHLGHIGVVSTIKANEFWTVEGNTTNGDGVQGVWCKRYGTENPSTKDKKFLGFIEPFILSSEL